MVTERVIRSQDLCNQRMSNNGVRLCLLKTLGIASQDSFRTSKANGTGGELKATITQVKVK